jgi:Na+/H+-dicarboxylate symporter
MQNGASTDALQSLCMKNHRLTYFVTVGMLLGVLAGYLCFRFFPNYSPAFSQAASVLPTIFLRLVRMIIAPLVFSTIVTGIAKMGDLSMVGRVGLRALGWFMLASLISLSIGAVLVNLLEPGKFMHVALPTGPVHGGSIAASPTFMDFVGHAVPVSIVDAMAHNEILQIVVFSLFFGSGAAALGERSASLVAAIEAIVQIMLKITGYVMLSAPLAAFGALASMVAQHGLGIVEVYGVFVGEFYLGLLVLWAALIGLGAVFLRGRIFTLLRSIGDPLLIAFSTASSEAAYPKTLVQLERFGCSSKISGFVLSLGYSFNLDGSMMYCAFAAVFVAQIYGIELSMSQQFLMLGMLMLTSKGVAGVPRVALVVLAAILPQFNLPEAGVALLLGIDQLLDMGRSATNVVGNSIAVAVVSRWEEP